MSSSTASAYASESPPAAAVGLRERDPHQPEPAELGHDLVREALLAVELLRDGLHLALGEVADGAADQLVVVGEVEVHARHRTE